MKNFYKDLSKDEVCRAYADHKWDKAKYNVSETFQESVWADEYDFASNKMNSDELLEWCVLYFG